MSDSGRFESAPENKTHPKRVIPSRIFAEKSTAAHSTTLPVLQERQCNHHHSRASEAWLEGGNDSSQI